MKGREKRFITQRGHVSTSVNLQDTDMSFRFKWWNNWGRGRETCKIKQFQVKCDLADQAQGDCKRQRLRVKKTDIKWRQGDQAFYTAFS
jgi:hypothetical protein